MISKHDLFLLVIYVDNLPLKYLQRVTKILKFIYGQYTWENIFTIQNSTLVKELYLLSSMQLILSIYFSAINIISIWSKRQEKHALRCIFFLKKMQSQQFFFIIKDTMSQVTILSIYLVNKDINWEVNSFHGVTCK